MATHRLQVRKRLRLRPILENLSYLSRREWVAITVRLVLFSGAMTAVLVPFNLPGAMVWLVLSIAEVTWDAIRWAAEARSAAEARLTEDRMMERLATAPGGGPLVADLGGHCGCVHRYAWDEVKGEWLRVTVVETNKYCPLVEGYTS